MMGHHVPTRTLTASASEESVRSLFEFPTSPDRPFGVMFLLPVSDFTLLGSAVAHHDACIVSWCSLVYHGAAWFSLV